jgi:hypothetical protein
MTGWRPPIKEPATTTPELTSDMTPQDIAFELKELTFAPNQCRQIKLDEPVRDWLLTRFPIRRA